MNLKIILLSFTISVGSFYDYFGQYHILYIRETPTEVDLTSPGIPTNNDFTIDLTESNDELEQKETLNDLQQSDKKSFKHLTKFKSDTDRKVPLNNTIRNDKKGKSYLTKSQELNWNRKMNMEIVEAQKIVVMLRSKHPDLYTYNDKCLRNRCLRIFRRYKMSIPIDIITY